jgi:hypothetical protein
LAIKDEAETLRAQLAETRAPVIVTLGQEAAHVLGGIERTKLGWDETYGREQEIDLGGRSTRWWPLVHPGNPRGEWRDALGDGSCAEGDRYRRSAGRSARLNGRFTPFARSPHRMTTRRWPG